MTQENSGVFIRHVPRHSSFERCPLWVIERNRGRGVARAPKAPHQSQVLALKLEISLRAWGGLQSRIHGGIGRRVSQNYLGLSRSTAATRNEANLS